MYLAVLACIRLDSGPGVSVMSMGMPKALSFHQFLELDFIIWYIIKNFKHEGAKGIPIFYAITLISLR